jgi:hypothetical protein
VVSSVHGVARQLVTGKEACLAVDLGQQVNAIDPDTPDGGVRMERGAQPRPGDPAEVTSTIR